MSIPNLVVFSHLRWGFVYQRPQHLLSRLAGRWRVVFIEEPRRCEGEAHLVCEVKGPHLTVVVPHTPVAAPGFHDDQLAVLETLIAEYLARERIRDAVAWLYTPMALPLATAIHPRCLVYDCMDELAAFKDAPRQLRQRESATMKRADVVFTGGPSLYAAKRGQHPNLHCIPSAVDARHFAPANLRRGSALEAEAEALQGPVPHPRLGFFGVIDERLDSELIGALAAARPDWQVVMVGPVVKIDPASLPQAPNLHWLGMQRYELLPYLLAGWDVCLMPFALNDATRFISPTKTLEYMAGEKPVVSTAVEDVVLLYGDVVRVVRGTKAFVAACDELLHESADARCRRALEMLTTVFNRSWDHSAETVHQLVDAAASAAGAATPRRAAMAVAVAEPVLAAGGTRA